MSPLNGGNLLCNGVRSSLATGASVVGGTAVYGAVGMVAYNVVSRTVCRGGTVDEVAVRLVLSLRVVLCFKNCINRYWGDRVHMGWWY
jgi:hypothetical protein